MNNSSKQRYEEQRDKVKVLILGPYGKCKNHLLKIREFLKGKGYTQTCIVEELPNLQDIPREPEDIYFLEKSKYYIKYWGEIIIIYVTTECDCKSVLRELSFLTDQVSHKCIFSTILRTKDYQFGTLFEGTIKVNRISEFSFENENQLYNMAFTACFYSLNHLRCLEMLS